MSERRYVYLMGDGLQATVIDSQVITVLKRLGERGLSFELIAYQPRPLASEQARVDRRRRELAAELSVPIRLWDLPAPRALVRPPRSAGDGENRGGPRAQGLATYTARRVSIAARDALLEARLIYHLAPSLLRGRTVVVHARGGAMRLGTRLKRWHRGLRVLADFRGDRPAEYVYKMGSLNSPLARREHAELLAQDRSVLHDADAVQCVSTALARQLADRHGAPSRPIRVVPCVADERRFVFDPDIRAKVRSAHGWDQRRVLVYSGSMLAWQQPEAVLALFAHLQPRRPNLHLLLLTPDVDQARALVAGRGLDETRVTVRSARYEEVSGFLCAADLALLLREPHPLNQVASPTKFAEYVLTGLPVLVSRGIGDLDDLVTRLDLGALVDDHRDVTVQESKVETLLGQPQDRPARSQRAAGTFALAPYVEEWVRLYESL